MAGMSRRYTTIAIAAPSKVDKVVVVWRMCSDTSMPLGRVDLQAWRVNHIKYDTLW